MKVKDFIAWIRPITALDPETELILWQELHHDDFKITSVEITPDDVTINLNFNDDDKKL